MDLRQTSPEQYVEMMTKYGSWLRHLLAEKVETREEFATAKKAGFRYFQGYLFRRPELVQSKEIPASRLNYLRLLRAVSQPELDHREFEDIDQAGSLHLLPFVALSELRRIWHSK